MSTVNQEVIALFNVAALILLELVVVVLAPPMFHRVVLAQEEQGLQLVEILAGAMAAQGV